MSQNMTPEQLAAQFEQYATEGFDAPPGSAIARIADAWSCAARQVRTKLAPSGELAKSLAAEADRLRDENERLKERLASIEETIHLQKQSLDYAKVTIANYKAMQCPSWAMAAKRVWDAVRLPGANT